MNAFPIFLAYGAFRIRLLHADDVSLMTKFLILFLCWECDLGSFPLNALRFVSYLSILYNCLVKKRR